MLEILAGHGFIDYMRANLPATVTAHGLYLFRGCPSELERVKEGGDVNSISKRFEDNQSANETRVYRSEPKVLTHLG